MIKDRLFALISFILFLALAYFIIERINFIRKAEKTEGKVTAISARDTRCGGGRRRSSHPCTKFDANVQYQVETKTYTIHLSAGSARGDDRPTDLASYTSGQNVSVIYNPKDPTQAYEDSFWGVWGVPVMLFFGQIVTFFFCLFKPKKSTEE